LAISNIAGSVVGARLALQGGNAFVRKVFVTIVVMLIIRTLWIVLR